VVIRRCGDDPLDPPELHPHPMLAAPQAVNSWKSSRRIGLTGGVADHVASVPNG
jgi:thymidine phosphorylase